MKENDSPLIITDGVLNVMPNIKTKMHILKNSIDFANRIGIKTPKVSVLSATEEVLESVPSSLEAKEITKLAKDENLKCRCIWSSWLSIIVFQKNLLQLKILKIKLLARQIYLLVPSVETGNALVKMMIYFMGACAAGVVIGGKVPVVITSRSDEAQARMASIAAAVVALD